MSDKTNSPIPPNDVWFIVTVVIVSMIALILSTYMRTLS